MLLLAAGLILAGTMQVSAQSNPPVLENSMTGAGRYAFSKLSALAVSPVSDRFAIADENLNRVFVFQSSGKLSFIIGETGFLTGPIALCFESDATILIVTKDKLIVRVTESNPELCDTVADLSQTTKPNQVRSISNLTAAESGYIAIDPELGQIVLIDPDWSIKKILVGHGHGSRGKVWEPSDIKRDLSGRLVVADRGDFPLQIFAPTGSLLVSADWNAPDRQRTWEASAVAITRQEIIWVADTSNRTWRLYDQTGSQISEFPFSPPGLLPKAAAVTVDNRLVVLDERGTVSTWSLLQ